MRDLWRVSAKLIVIFVLPYLIGPEMGLLEGIGINIVTFWSLILEALPMLSSLFSIES